MYVVSRVCSCDEGLLQVARGVGKVGVPHAIL